MIGPEHWHPGIARDKTLGSVTRRLSRKRLREFVERNANAETKSINANESHQRANEFDILFLRQTRC
jgi:hypothetical protein